MEAVVKLSFINTKLPKIVPSTDRSMAKLIHTQSLIAVLILLVLPSCYPKHAIIAVLQLDHTDLPTLSWERGLEILPGAQVAIEHVNHYYNISSENQFELKAINSGKCRKEFKEELVNDFLNVTLYQNLSQVGVIGLFCLTSEQLLSNIAKHIGISPIVVSSSVLITHNSQMLNNYHNILPSANIFIDAISSLMVHLRRIRIAVVTQSTDIYFLQVAEALYHKATVSNAYYKVIPFIQLHTGQPVERAFQELQRFHSNIIFLSTNINKSVHILCTAKRMGYIWPDYAWILHSIKVVDFIAAAHTATCNIYKALEGVVLLEHQLSPANVIPDMAFSYGKDYKKKLTDLSARLRISLRPNPYAITLYNAVWVYSMAIYSQMINTTPDSLKNIHYAQTTGFNSTGKTGVVVNIYQIKNGSSVYEGYYDHIRKNIAFTGSLLEGSFPSDNHNIITDRASLLYTSILSLVLLVITILVTLILVLYVYYHKEPEIKSTSVTLSLLMFCGCYIILLYLLLAIIYTQSLVPSTSPFNICTAITWLNITGVSLPLILATLLVKMLRVFHIFTLYGKISRMCSDSALLIYVLILISPCIVVLIFWSAIDPYTAKTITTEYPGYSEVEQRCSCNYLLLWIGLLIVNILILIMVLLIVAVKTRKIRQSHFKDTKKVNAFLFILVTVIFLTLAYWMIFRTIGAKKGYSDITLHFAHIIIVGSCQGFLFVPKLLPPLQRSISKRYRLKASNSSKTRTTTLTLTN